GVGKGASFIRHGFKSKKKGEDDTNGSLDADDIPVANSDVFAVPRRASNLPPPPDNGVPTTPPGTAMGASPHSRTKSFGASSLHSTAQGTPSAASGTASFTI